MSRRSLKVSMGLPGAIPLVSGVLTMMDLSDPVLSTAGLPAQAVLDSNLRFFLVDCAW
jgi:hypothetical protein